MNTYRIHMESDGLAPYSILVLAKTEDNARRNMERKIQDIAHHGNTFKIVRIELV